MQGGARWAAQKHEDVPIDAMTFVPTVFAGRSGHRLAPFYDERTPVQRKMGMVATEVI